MRVFHTEGLGDWVPVLGVVSRWQDNPNTTRFPNLQIAKDAGYACVKIKIGGGYATGTMTGVLDPAAKKWVEEANRVGMPWQAVWWTKPTQSSPRDQAGLAWWWANVYAADRKDLLLPCVCDDNEEESAETAAMAPVHRAGWHWAFANQLAIHTGSIPAYYTFRDFWQRIMIPGQISFEPLSIQRAAWPGALPTFDPAGWEPWLQANRAKWPGPLPLLGDWDYWQIDCNSGWGAELGMESEDVCVGILKVAGAVTWGLMEPPTPPPHPDTVALGALKLLVSEFANVRRRASEANILAGQLHTHAEGILDRLTGG